MLLALSYQLQCIDSEKTYARGIKVSKSTETFRLLQLSQTVINRSQSVSQLTEYVNIHFATTFQFVSIVKWSSSYKMTFPIAKFQPHSKIPFWMNECIGRIFLENFYQFNSLFVALWIDLEKISYRIYALNHIFCEKNALVRFELTIDFKYFLHFC